MPGIVLANRAAFLLASSISPTSLTFSVQPGTGSRCPEISGGNFAFMGFKDASGNFEVVRVTGHVAGSDVFTIASTADRGLDGTTARSWLANDSVRMSLPRAALWEIMNGAATDLGIAGGTENALTVTADPPGFSGYSGGHTFKVTPSSTNTGAATLAIGGRPARAIYDGTDPVVAGDLRAGYTALLYDDGARYQLINPAFRAKRIHTHPTSDIVGLDALLVSMWEDPVVTGDGLTLPANATELLHAVPLQQMQAEINALKAQRRGTISYTTGVPPAGMSIKPTGGLVSRTTYADLWAWVQASGLLVTESAWAAGRIGCYTAGDGSTTFRLPLIQGVTIKAYHDGNSTYESDPSRLLGSFQDDAIRNISGTFTNNGDSGGFSDASGAFTRSGSALVGSAGQYGANSRVITFNASNVVQTAAENRVKNITYQPFIWL